MILRGGIRAGQADAVGMLPAPFQFFQLMHDELSELYARRAILRTAIDREMDRKAEIENTLDALARSLDDVNVEIAATLSGRSTKAEKYRRYRIPARPGGKPISISID